MNKMILGEKIYLFEPSSKEKKSITINTVSNVKTTKYYRLTKFSSF